jgi:hypothetical protein
MFESVVNRLTPTESTVFFAARVPVTQQAPNNAINLEMVEADQPTSVAANAVHLMQRTDV